MQLQKMKDRIEDRKKGKNEVAELLAGVRKTFGDTDLDNALHLRMDEINSFIQVIQGSLDCDLHDESFYKEHVGRAMYLLEERFDELQIMVDALIEQKDKNRPKKAVA